MSRFWVLAAQDETSVDLPASFSAGTPEESPISKPLNDHFKFSSILDAQLTGMAGA